MLRWNNSPARAALKVRQFSMKNNAAVVFCPSFARLFLLLSYEKTLEKGSFANIDEMKQKPLEALHKIRSVMFRGIWAMSKTRGQVNWINSSKINLFIVRCGVNIIISFTPHLDSTISYNHREIKALITNFSSSLHFFFFYFSLNFFGSKVFETLWQIFLAAILFTSPWIVQLCTGPRDQNVL